MARSRNQTQVCDALYVSWQLDGNANSANSLKRALSEGEGRNLYRLRSWMVARGEARALLIPEAPLEEITGALWHPVARPAAARWIEGQRRCAALTREIETAPVELGLARRPEEWPLSSAFQE
jgi:hypothetical protein